RPVDTRGVDATGGLAAGGWGGGAAHPGRCSATDNGRRCNRTNGTPHNRHHSTVAAAGVSAAVTVASRGASTAAASPHSAANDSQSPGTARSPVRWMRYVLMAGVKPPKMAVARL